MMPRDAEPTEENPGHLHDLAEASVVAVELRQAPKLVREDPRSQRVTFVFSGDPARIILARQKYWSDTPIPGRSLLAVARDLKAAVRTPNYGGRP